MASDTHAMMKWRLVVLCMVCALIGGLIARIIFPLVDNGHDTSIKYPLLAHRLFEAEHDDMIINFTQLRESLKTRHAEKKLPLGIYFEYLPTGASIGVNDQLEVEIGSLSKVPAVIAVYKQIENGTMTLDQVLTVEEKISIHFLENFGRRVQGRS